MLNFANCMLFFTSNLGYSDAQQGVRHTDRLHATSEARRDGQGRARHSALDAAAQP